MSFTYFHWLIAMSLKIPASKLKVVPVVAGGSFGSKFFMHKVPTFAGFLSMVAERPVKFVEDRMTHIASNDHCGSDRWYDAELAFEDDGTLRALRIDCVDDYGAYLQFGTGTHGNGLSQIVGPYQIQEVQYTLHAVLTNKNQQGAYRGFGAEVSNWMLERLVDMAALDLGMDRMELRRRNLITPDQFPYRTPTGNIYDSGNYEAVLERLLEVGEYERWVAPELQSERDADIAVVRQGLDAGEDTLPLTEAQALAWLRAFNHLRLAAGRILGVEADGWEERADATTRATPEFGILLALAYLQEELVAALES